MAASLTRRRAFPVLVALAGLLAFVAGAAVLAVSRATDQSRTTVPASATPVAGRWEIAPGTAVGYRIGQRIAGVRSEAVARTDRVAGSLTLRLRGATLVVEKGARVVVDMRSLASDDPARDRALRERGLETDRYPTASFVTAFDTPVPTDALDTPRQLILRGVLTLHGVSRTIAVPVSAGLVGGRILVDGELEVTLGDWGIRPPEVPGLVTVEPEGTLRFDLVFQRR